MDLHLLVLDHDEIKIILLCLIFWIIIIIVLKKTDRMSAIRQLCSVRSYLRKICNNFFSSFPNTYCINPHGLVKWLTTPLWKWTHTKLHDVTYSPCMWSSFLTETKLYNVYWNIHKKEYIWGFCPRALFPILKAHLNPLHWDTGEAKHWH